MSEADKYGGSSSLGPSNTSFKLWADSAGLIDMGYHGPAYTWSNKRPDTDNISERLDRAVANLEWTLLYPTTMVFHLPRFNSDHLPILVRTDLKQPSNERRFRCENWWMECEGFKKVCSKSVMKGLGNWTQVQRSFRKQVRNWAVTRKSPEAKLKEIEQQMLAVNSMQPDEHTIALDHKLQMNHEKCLQLQELFWHQRARVNWAVHGDRNSKFFHAMAVVRHRRNRICSVTDGNGVRITGEKEIRLAFIHHFRAIYAGQLCEKLSQVYPQDMLNTLPKVPLAAHHHLIVTPSEHEIRKAMMSLGPDKSPGPDGFNARIIQANWELFGPPIVNQVTQFFTGKVMPRQVARSNLVLVPKCDNAAKLTDFRPISVCNVVYKLISKILATRVRPYIAGCVSQDQCAFVPGRNISENVILLREIIHSFQSKSYRGDDFCLKLDLSKAFDKMSWSYLRDVLLLYGWPSLFVDWVMLCVESAEYTIVLNGRGDGFFKPAAGLRQGCALSPYLFIMGMDILSRRLQYLVQAGLMEGIKLAHSAPTLSNCLYADDLLIFGKATVQGATCIRDTVQLFCSVSGQKVGLEKSSIWYSVKVGDDVRESVANILTVPQHVACAKYLGSPIATTAASYHFLIEKISSKFQSWKSRLLSQSGRVVLIKSVLQALLIYYMATSLIPKGVIKQIEILIRSFFWGKLGKSHYLAYVAWKEIAKPIDEGGLGLRDLGKVNEALLLKSLWKLASGSDAPWAQQVRAKYLPRSELWLSKRSYKCTQFWRSIMMLRETLLPWVAWKVGDGRTCTAFAQPWFEGALEHRANTTSQKLLTLAQLVDEQTAYKALIEPISTTANQDRSLWRVIWKKGFVVPRVRLFLWKLLRDAVPLASILAFRLRRGDQTCQMCGQHGETVGHMIFLCPFSMGCWMLSQLPLRTGNLSMPLKQVIHEFGEEFSGEQWTEFANVTWALWRCRNDQAYGGKQPTVHRFSKYLKQITRETLLAATSNTKINEQVIHPILPEGGLKCFSDGSWSEGWQAGIGFVFMEKGSLIMYKAQSITAYSPLHAEALGMLCAVKWAVQNHFSKCVFYTDCINLVQLVVQHQPPEPDWTATREIYELWEILRMNRNYVCMHLERSHNELAHNLANKTRRECLDYIGFTFPMFSVS